MSLSEIDSIESAPKRRDVLINSPQVGRIRPRRVWGEYCCWLW